MADGDQLIGIMKLLGYHALGAMLIDSQGYDVDLISINGVNARKNIDFGVAAFFNPSVANKWTKVKNYSEEYKDEAGATTNKNLSWYLLYNLILDNEPNDKVLQFILENEHQGMATNLGLIDVRYFLPMKEQFVFSNKFDGLTCGYQIPKRGFDKDKNKNYEYTINIGRFIVEGGQLAFGKNIWKTGGITLDKDHMDASANLLVQDVRITGEFPVFTATKKKEQKWLKLSALMKAQAFYLPRNLWQNSLLCLMEIQKTSNHSFLGSIPAFRLTPVSTFQIQRINPPKGALQNIERSKKAS